eukprot:m51a1_g14141 putative importin- n-terminal domain-containing protein (1269) ;mRNA; r:288-5005
MGCAASASPKPSPAPPLRSAAPPSTAPACPSEQSEWERGDSYVLVDLGAPPSICSSGGSGSLCLWLCKRGQRLALVQQQAGEEQEEQEEQEEEEEEESPGRGSRGSSRARWSDEGRLLLAVLAPLLLPPSHAHAQGDEGDESDESEALCPHSARVELIPRMDIRVVEELATLLYSSPDPGERQRAEGALKITAPSAAALAQCQFILENSSSPYAQLLGTSTLLRLMSDHWNTFTDAQRLATKNVLLQLLWTRGPQLPNYVSQSAVQGVARITKLGWFDPGQQDVCEGAARLVDTSPAHCALGLRLLAALVEEMSSSSSASGVGGTRGGGSSASASSAAAPMSVSQQRKTSGSFRDRALQPMFALALAVLHRPLGPAVQEAALRLALQCLSYDFIGTTQDDSGEDVGTVQIPASWRSHFEGDGGGPPVSSLAMECVVQVASVRRSLFSGEAERARFLAALMGGVRDVLQRRVGLGEQANHHAVCRLLTRIKANYQLLQLVGVEGWRDWITLVAQFSFSSLAAWRWSPSSAHYLLSFWSRLVTSLLYLTNNAAPTYIEDLAPQIAQAYIAARLDSVAATGGGGDGEEDDVLGATDEAASDYLEFLPSLGRCQYAQTSATVINYFDTLVASLQELLKASPSDADQQQQQAQGQGQQTGAEQKKKARVVQGQLAWMVHVAGALLSGRLSLTASDETDRIDGELSCRVFNLMRITDARLEALGAVPAATAADDSRLEFAYLAFMQQFRRMYIGDTSMSSSKAYTRMGELMGLSSHTLVLNLCIKKIMTNLRYWRGTNEVLDKTLGFFSDLASGFSSGKLVARLEVTAQILQQHASEFFAFSQTPRGYRQRRVLYSVLGRLLLSEDHLPRFDEFVVPIERTMAALLALPSPEALAQPQPRAYAVGVMCELCGLASAVTSKRAYTTLFEWLHPRFTPLISRLAEALALDSEASAALLRFVSELAWNKYSRISFESSSPNGILLFKEVSRAIVAYASRVLAAGPAQAQAPSSSSTSSSSSSAAALGTPRDVYKERYRQVVLCFEALTRSLSGDYANFGVFALYGDRCLVDALDAVLRLVLGVPLPELLAYAKLARAYYTFLDVLCSAHAAFVVASDAAVFVRVALSLEEAIKSVDVSLRVQGCTALDGLLSWYVAARKKDPAAAQRFEQHLAPYPDFIPRLFEHLFETLLFSDCQHQCTLSKPIHSLIVAAPAQYEEAKQRLVLRQPQQDQQQRLADAFKKLADDTELALDTRAREKFTQGLVIFGHSAKAFISPC